MHGTDTYAVCLASQIVSPETMQAERLSFERLWAINSDDKIERCKSFIVSDYTPHVHIIP